MHSTRRWPSNRRHVASRRPSPLPPRSRFRHNRRSGGVDVHSSAAERGTAANASPALRAAASPNAMRPPTASASSTTATAATSAARWVSRSTAAANRPSGHGGGGSSSARWRVDGHAGRASTPPSRRRRWHHGDGGGSSARGESTAMLGERRHRHFGDSTRRWPRNRRLVGSRLPVDCCGRSTKWPRRRR